MLNRSLLLSPSVSIFSQTSICCCLCSLSPHYNMLLMLYSTIFFIIPIQRSCSKSLPLLLHLTHVSLLQHFCNKIRNSPALQVWKWGQNDGVIGCIWPLIWCTASYTSQNLSRQLQCTRCSGTGRGAPVFMSIHIAHFCLFCLFRRSSLWKYLSKINQRRLNVIKKYCLNISLIKKKICSKKCLYVCLSDTRFPDFHISH